MNPMEIQIHLDNVKQGDYKSFHVIYDLYVDRIYFFVIKFIKSRDQTNDIVQDVFIRIWEKRNQIDLSKSFEGFLFKIAKNEVLNTFSRSKREESILQEIMFESIKFLNTTENNLEMIETSQLIQEGINQLPSQQKKIFELCKMEGLTYEQAAAELNLSVSTINTQMVNALRFLRNYLILTSSVRYTLISSLFFFLA